MDRGFVISDHVDWPGLLQTIDATAAERVGVTHGYSNVVVRYLREQGRDAFTLPTRYEGEAGEEERLEQHEDLETRQGGEAGDAS